MRSSWLSDKVLAGAEYESSQTLTSQVIKGVGFTVLKMSFGRRMELLRNIRELAAKLPYLESSNDFGERIEANLLEQAIEELYVRWGVSAITGLRIDGEEASVDLLIQKGPEYLTREIAAAVKTHSTLSEAERKN